MLLSGYGYIHSGHVQVFHICSGAVDSGVICSGGIDVHAIDQFLKRRREPTPINDAETEKPVWRVFK